MLHSLSLGNQQFVKTESHRTANNRKETEKERKSEKLTDEERKDRRKLGRETDTEGEKDNDRQSRN